MTAHSEEPPDVRPIGKRRAARVRPGPLRVRLHRTCEGVLVDISEVGALVQIPSAPAIDKRITMHLEWDAEMLQLTARVVRSSPYRVELPAATLVRSQYEVAVEFSDVPEPTATILRRMISTV